LILFASLTFDFCGESGVMSHRVAFALHAIRRNNPLSIILKTRHCLHVVQQLSWSTTVLFKHEMLNSNTENLTTFIYNGKGYPHNGTPWQQLWHIQDWGTDDE